MPTRDEILVANGPQLTQLAYQLGLAPAEFDRLGYVWEDDVRYEGMPYRYNCDEGSTPWMPHENVSQAREMFFDVLPTLGDFDTERNDYRTNAWCDVWGKGDLLARRYWRTKNPGNRGQCDATEALALLRCACLAVVALRQGKKEP